MRKEIQDLIRVSHYYGKGTDWVIAGGGNTSCKNRTLIYVKASGTTLGRIKEDEFAILDRKKVRRIIDEEYSRDPVKMEEEVKRDLLDSRIDPQGPRPSVETSLHEMIEYKYVVHTHPYIINSLLCSRQSESGSRKIFSDRFLYIPYTTPGYILAKKVHGEIKKYQQRFNMDPHVIFLQNHGIFVSADSIAEIKSLYRTIEKKIISQYKNRIRIKPLNTHKVKLSDFMPAMRMLLSKDGMKILRFRNNNLIDSFCSAAAVKKVLLPFMPDDIVYCRAAPLFIKDTFTSERILNSFISELGKYIKKWGYQPKIILLKGIGMIGSEENIKSVNAVLDTFEDVMKTSHFSKNFGGPNFMKPGDIHFIDNWEVEKYRRKMTKTREGPVSSVDNRIAVVTGGASGIGSGITEDLLKQGANVMIADINRDKGKEIENDYNMKNKNNQVVFIKTDISDPASIQKMLSETVKQFGGLDLLVSNAGVLIAGGLEEMNDDDFSFVTNINYTGYYLCSKYSSTIMKLQHRYKDDHFMDIIQINSKSGLRGSNRNFAYAGGKFGSIGLTQSFALELVEHRIKVNSICPGNFFEGPLWSDPENGLFTQYLKAGKVPGAKSVDDVKQYYENLVPLKRGCMIGDIMKAVYYIIEQKYETGQAVPVTGGQVMLK